MNLKTIAQAAGVSTATVSNVINGNHHKVSKETIERVEKIIRESNYRPNATARSLASKKSNMIGVVLPNIGEQGNFAENPHYAHLLALLENNIRNKGYYMLLSCVQKTQESIPELSSWNVDGIIFMGTFREEIPGLRKNLRVPAVFIDTYAEDLGIVNVGVDDYRGGWLSASHLLDCGHRAIAFVGPSVGKLDVMQKRYEGFRDACAQRGVELEEEDVFLAWTTYAGGVDAGRRIAAAGKNYTAVAAMSDIAAFGVMEGLRRSGMEVPRDVSVIGFDDLMECQYSYPRLSTISQNVEQKAQKAVSLLYRMISGGAVSDAQVMSDVKVVERDSVRNLNK